MLELEDPIEAEEAKAKESDQGGDRNRMSRLPALQCLRYMQIDRFCVLDKIKVRAVYISC